MAANSSTQPREVSTSVEGREGAVKVVQSSMAQSNTSKASESYFLKSFDRHTSECENQAMVAGEGYAGDIQSDPTWWSITFS